MGDGWDQHAAAAVGNRSAYNQGGFRRYDTQGSLMVMEKQVASCQTWLTAIWQAAKD